MKKQSPQKKNEPTIDDIGEEDMLTIAENCFYKIA